MNRWTQVILFALVALGTRWAAGSERAARELFRDALVASGAAASEFEGTLQRWRQQLEAECVEDHVQLFRFLHDRVLTGDYQTDCSCLDETLRTGNYNCVTATILYMVLCDARQIETTAIAAGAHVFCRLAATDADVQTTCSAWFSQEFPPQFDEPRRALTRAQLVAKIYYNRGIQQLAHGRYAEAIDLFNTSIHLDPDDSFTRNNRAAAYNNWALALADTSEYASAVARIRRGLTYDPGFEPLLANDLHVHQLWLTSLCDQHDFARAIDVLQRAGDRRPDAAFFKQGQVEVYRRWAETLLSAGKVDEAERIVNLARELLRQTSTTGST